MLDHYGIVTTARVIYTLRVVTFFIGFFSWCISTVAPIHGQRRNCCRFQQQIVANALDKPSTRSLWWGLVLSLKKP